jgi:hypothetical protein
MRNSFLVIASILGIGLMLYPPLQSCWGNGVCMPSNEHGWIFKLPFLREVDYSRLATYIFLLIFIMLIANWIIGKNSSNLQPKSDVDDDMLLIVLKPTLLKISENVAYFRTQGMSKKEALGLIEETKETLPKIVHPYVLSTVNNVYKLSMNDVEILAANRHRNG